MATTPQVVDRPIALNQRSARGIPPLVALAGVFILLVIVAAVFRSWIVPHSPYAQDLALSASRPNGTHWLGTDNMGRDILSRTIFGSRTALIGPAIVAAGGFTIAMCLGLPAGYLRGRVESIVMRWVDLMYSLPGLLVTIVVVGTIGGGYYAATFMLMVMFSPADTRIVRGEVVRQRALPYVESLRTLGVPARRIMFVHIARNVLPVVMAYVFLDFAFALVALSGLSFLGVGVAPGTPDWGRMLFENRDLIFTSPLTFAAPVVAIVATAASMNVFGDWVFSRMSRRAVERA
ncbi:MAG: ABC transporter permease [Actinomycetia bacterium]|nr:ABC transporter permease [Actinomycetes bacterium]